MAEHAARDDDTGRKSRHRGAETRTPVVGLLAGIVRWAGLLVALVLVAHVVLVMGNANPDNMITALVRGAAEPLSLAFKSLFTPVDAKLGVLVNYGIATVFWLATSSALARLIRRLA